MKPEVVKLYPNKINMSMNKTGINILSDASRPLLTPRAITAAVKNIKSVCQIVRPTGSASIALKAAPEPSEVTPAKAPEAVFPTYSNAQPAMTL